MKTHAALFPIEILEARIAPAAVASLPLAELDGSDGFKLQGAVDVDRTGAAVSEAGDVNGDGFGDVIISAHRAEEGGMDRGAAYVVFGKAGGFTASAALAGLDGTNGFKLSGVADTDLAGRAVSAAGDVNGDGFDDVLVGAPYANEGGSNRGAVYVVFGKAGGFTATVSLGALNGTDGFKLSGVADTDRLGFGLGRAGDVNGDGFGDVIVGAGFAAEGGTNRGAAYVVFGKPGGFAASLALGTLDGSNGFKIGGITSNNSYLGFAVSGAGDVNGDGFDDVVVGANRAPEGGFDRGAVFVLFGKAGGFGASFGLGTVNGSNGFKLGGVGNQDNFGDSVSGAGDVNGDGFDDVLIGAFGVDDGLNARGAAFVVFGKAGGFPAFVPQASLDGTTGFKLGGVGDADQAGNSVSSAGDVNGDGLADLIIGADGAEDGGGTRGVSYVVFGKAAGFPATLALSALDGSDGFKLPGVADADKAGGAVSGAGDVNGDGFADLIVGAYHAAEGGSERGAAYVVFGRGTADVVVATSGKSATFTDWDGDLVTIKSTKGPLDAAQFRLSSPNPVTGGAHLVYADFTAGAGFAKANLIFTAKRGPTGGDGLVNVGTIDARGVLLGKVSVDGDLQQIDAAGVAGLTVFSMGQFAAAEVHGAPLTSEIGLKLGALTVKTDASRVTLAAQTFGAIKALNLDGVRILAGGVVNPATAAAALAIKSLTIGGSVRAAQILAGYNSAGLAVNADVAIGKVVVKGQWIASDLVAGAATGLDGIFGTAADALIGSGGAIVAKIASITIGGAAFGTLGNFRDGFGFVAEEIGAVSIGKAKLPLTKGAGNDLTPLLAGLTGDLRLREVAA